MPSDDWRSEAACRGLTPRFFLSALEPLARATCAACPVRVECQQAGLGEPHGVWGGLNATERRRVTEKRKRKRTAVCGTDSGYQRHRYDRTEPCAACRAAHAAANRRRDSAA